MSILVDRNTKVITQGITGKTGQFHTRMCRDYANGKACFVAGVNPKKAGETFEGIPIHATVKEAKEASGATVSVIYVPPPFAAAAIDEAVDADLDLVIAITEGIPVRDMIRGGAEAPPYYGPQNVWRRMLMFISRPIDSSSASIDDPP